MTCSPATYPSSTHKGRHSRMQDEHLILPDAISKEPLGPAVRQDDPAWAMLVRWVHFALVDAEELVSAARPSTMPSPPRSPMCSGSSAPMGRSARSWG